MTLETDQDRADYVADFGVDVDVGSGVILKGVFDNEHREDLDIAGSRPQLTFRTKDIDDSGSNLATGDTVTIGTDAYTVRVIQKDGTGMTLLELEAQ